MEYLYLSILGLVQGLTEFLPVSSSGHLVLFQHFFGLNEGGLLINLVLHTATLFAVILFFYKEIIELFKSLSYKKNPKLYWIVMANIPTAIIGLLLKKVYGDLSSIWIVGLMLLVTGTLLIVIKNKQEGEGELTAKKSLAIGVLQGLAVTPGISRSGATIAGSLFMGIKKETAFAFSFLLSIPAIIGADLLELKDLLKTGFSLPVSLGSLIMGFVISFITGILALFFLKKLIKANRFHYFAYYCFIIGLCAIVGGLL